MWGRGQLPLRLLYPHHPMPIRLARTVPHPPFPTPVGTVRRHRWRRVRNGHYLQSLIEPWREEVEEEEEEETQQDGRAASPLPPPPPPPLVEALVCHHRRRTPCYPRSPPSSHTAFFRRILPKTPPRQLPGRPRRNRPWRCFPPPPHTKKKRKRRRRRFRWSATTARMSIRRVGTICHLEGAGSRPFPFPIAIQRVRAPHSAPSTPSPPCPRTRTRKDGAHQRVGVLFPPLLKGVPRGRGLVPSPPSAAHPRMGEVGAAHCSIPTVPRSSPHR